MKRLPIIIFAAFMALFTATALAGQYGVSMDWLMSQVRTNSQGSLSGGKVYAYAAGTLTPKTIYLDRGKTSVAANPYTLDSNGTAQLFGDGLYKIVVKDSAGVTRYTRDYLNYDSSLPTFGNHSSNYYLNSSNQNAGTLPSARLPSIPGTLIKVVDKTTGTTYTPSTGTTQIIVELVGGGGGGGGVTGSGSNSAVGSGGGGGGYAITYLMTVSGACTYAIGTAGTAGASSATAAGDGGDTTFTMDGTTWTAKGGTGGMGMVYGTTAATNAGGVSTKGTYPADKPGQTGGTAIRFSGTVSLPGKGGDSTLGGGGNTSTVNSNGANGQGYGGGGAGAWTTGANSYTGGIGSTGVIRIWEYK